MSIIGIIPARLESSRLPRKLLLNETGKPLIQHTWESAKSCESLDELYIATDSQEIADAVEAFGGKVLMTGDHPSGTDRIAAAVKSIDSESIDPELVVNIQGDEPEIDPHQISQLVASLKKNPNVEMATLATLIHDAKTLNDHGCVKVVCEADGRAMYFSRSPIPHLRDMDVDQYFAEQKDSPVPESIWLMHIGLYAYRTEFLEAFTRMPPSRLEQVEKLEQLRALEAGASIQVEIVGQHSVGIDTPEDYAAFVERFNSLK